MPQANDWVDNGGTMAVFVGYIGYAVFIAWIIAVRRRRIKIAAGMAAAAVENGDAFDPRMVSGDFASPPEWLPGMIRAMWKGGIAFYFAASIFIGITLARQIQFSFTLSEVNAMTATACFLVPLQEIFRFLEDTVLVRISRAIGAKQRAVARKIFWYSRCERPPPLVLTCALSLHRTGLRYSAISGTLLALLCTVLALEDRTAKALLQPGQAGGRNSCALLDASIDKVRDFFILQAWQTPLLFAMMVLEGYLMAAMHFVSMLWARLPGLIVLVALFYALDRNPTNLAAIYLASTATNLAFTALFLAKDKGLAERTGVYITKEQTPDGSHHESESDASDVALDSASTASLARDGLKVMMLDLSIQLSTTITYYLAYASSAATAYKLVAVGAAMPQLGLIYAGLLALMLKVFGASMLGCGNVSGFIFLSRGALVVCASLWVSLLVQLTAFRRPLWYEYGQSACLFASSESCIPLYESIFHSDESLFDLNDTVGVVVAVQLAMGTCRGILMALLDFDFIYQLSIGSFVIAYIPAILIACEVYDRSANSMLIATYITDFFILAGMIVRVVRKLKSLDAAMPSQQLKSLDAAMPSQLSSSAQAEDAGRGRGGLREQLLEAEA